MKNRIRHSKRLHKLVAQAFLFNPENKPFVDHIDNNRRNNNLNNLRFATSQENSQNRSISSKNTSGTKGVSWHKGQKRWLAKICINGKVIQ